MTTCTQKAVTVVSAPPGAGKTYAVAAWARARPVSGRVAWLTIDRGDDAPGVFWAYVISALRYRGVPLDDVRPPARPDTVDRSLLARLAASIAELDKPVFLVLDQIEAAASGEVSAGLDFVLRHTGANLRLIVTTRADPVLPVHRYRLSGELAEIGREALAFTHAEAAALFDRDRSGSASGPRLSAEAVSLLLHRTEGWAGGLRLYALALRQVDEPERFVREPSTSADAVADYLCAEVFDALAPATRDLLQRVSVLERIHPDLADQLTGRDDAAGILRELAKANAFIDRIENTGQWYRCHPMFAGALRDQLAVHQPGIQADLHRRAAHWFAAAGRLTDSIRHAAVVEDWEFASAQLVEQLAVGRLLGGRGAHPLVDLFAKMPMEQPTSAATALVAAALATGEAEPERAVAHLEAVGRLTEQLPRHRRPAYRLGAAVLRVVVGRLLGEVTTARDAMAQADATMPECAPDRLARQPDLAAVMLVNLGAAQLWAGELDSAGRTLRRAVEISGTPELEYLRHGAHGQLALLELVRGRLRQAYRHACEAVAVADRSGTPVTFHSGAGRAALAAVAFEHNDGRNARSHLRDALATVDARQDPMVIVELALTRSRIDRAGGRYDSALDMIGQALTWTERHGAPGWIVDRLLAEQVRVHLGARDVAAAGSCLDRIGQGPERGLALARIRLATGRSDNLQEPLGAVERSADRTRGDLMIQASLLRAQAAFAVKDNPVGRAAVIDAFELARAEGFRRPFLEAGVWLRHALSRNPDLNQVRRWLAGELEHDVQPGRTAAAAAAQRPPGTAVESLSRREREVLGLLAQGFTAQEISAELYVSVNTVKTHLKGIYRKLAASRRREAVRYARQLNLI